MSLDRSLKSKTALSRSRNVLTRAERLKVLKDEERWEEGRSVFALAKVRQRRSTAGQKQKTEKAEAAPEAAAGTEAAPAAETKPAKG